MLTTRRRISVRIKNPNPLFKKWLTEWIAYAKKKRLKEQECTFQRALTALEKYPLQIATGKDCLILDGFGKGICEMLDKKLERFRAQKSTVVQVPAVVSQIPIEPIEKTTLRRSKSFGLASPEKAAPLAEKNNKGSTGPSKRLRKTKSENVIGITKLKQPVIALKPPEIQPDLEILVSPGRFEIILLVDAQETIGKNKRSVDATIVELEKNKIKYEVRRLNVGDFTWIARTTDGIELVLPYIVERKRLDDLAQSIKNGRFHEQKFRLRGSGIPNIIYLIEFIALNHYGLPINSLSQAVINAEVHNDCQIKFTDSAKETILFLSVQTEILEGLFRNKLLNGCSKEHLQPFDINAEIVTLMHFSEFNSLASKWGAVKVRDFFIRQLIQLFQMSVEKAMAITNVYSTPRSLLNAYDDPHKSELDRQSLLSKITYGVTKRPIGLSLSKIVYDLFHIETPS